MAHDTAVCAATAAIDLGPDAAFVLQLARSVGRRDEAMRGRVEHIATGTWTYFESSAELLAFVQATVAATTAAP